MINQVTMTLSNGITILLPSVYNNISYTVDGKNNLTFVPIILTSFNTTTITPTITASKTPTPTSSDTTTSSSTSTFIAKKVEVTPPVAQSPPSASPITLLPSNETSTDNAKLYIGIAVAGGVVGIAATAALILYCYKKHHLKITSQISPSNSQDAGAIAALPSIELTIENSRANSYSRINQHSDVISEPSNKDKMNLSVTTIPTGSFARDHASGKVIDLEISSSRSDLSRALLVGFESNMENSSSSIANDGIHLEQNSVPVTVRKYSFLAS